MRRLRIALLVLAAGCSGTARTHPARTGPTLPCELRDYTIRSVAAYMERDGRTKVGVERMRGAELFVEARPGLTAEWLQLQLERHVKAGRTAALTADCPLDIDDPSVSVQSSGPGFVVRIRAGDEHDAGEILRRSRALASAQP